MGESQTFLLNVETTECMTGRFVLAPQRTHCATAITRYDAQSSDCLWLIRVDRSGMTRSSGKAGSRSRYYSFRAAMSQFPSLRQNLMSRASGDARY